ncbi:MAG: hypothetical protein AAFX52_16025 [Pseudomonadota bacterium]
MDHPSVSLSALGAAFEQATDEPNERAKLPAPFSIRFTEEERAWLDSEAGNLPLSAYIRAQLFPSHVVMQSARRSKKRPREPQVDHAALATALGHLGRSRLASNLNQIAKAAHIGALPVTPELCADLQDACEDVREMRTALMRALGLKVPQHLAAQGTHPAE